MTYIEWLAKENKDSALMDLSHDINADYSFPKTNEFEDMYIYLIDSKIDSEIIQLFVWSYAIYSEGIKLERLRKEIPLFE